MKLVLINDMLWGGGRERRIVQLVAGLNRLGIRDITLILLDDRVDYPEIFEMDVNVIKIQRSSNRDLSVFVKLLRILREIRPDVVNPWSYMSTFYSAPICLALKIPVIGAFVVDAKRPKAGSINWLAMQIGFLLSKKVVGNSSAGHQAYRTPASKRVVIYNGFDRERLSAITKQATGAAPLTLAMIGRLDRQKDYRTYIEALGILRTRGISFRAFVAGQGEDEHMLKAYAAQCCGDSITFTGFIRDIDSFIANVDIGVLCTAPAFHAEGISNAVMEIMAQGKPVVATDAGGTPEIIADGADGFLVPAHDAGLLADRLALLIEDAELRRSFGNRAAAKISSKFGLNRMASEFVEAYRGCL